MATRRRNTTTTQVRTLKRKNRELTRTVTQALQQQGRATALVLGLLVQAGGIVTLSQGTTERLNHAIGKMGYRIEPSEEGLVRLVLVMADDTQKSETTSRVVLTDTDSRK